MRKIVLVLLLVCGAPASWAQYNLKVVTDASPDYSDLPSLVHSATSRWETPEEKCRAMFYWNRIARRQTNPIVLHGLALTDPIRQFNDYGYTMCSTISGINQAIWEEMGLPHRYWDVTLHTVSEVFYDGRWHLYDNSLSALYTLCDGRTLAGVEDVGKAGACAASGGKSEPGHVAKYHCLTATSPNGFLTGADTIRSTSEETRVFNPNGLKLRTYFYDWDAGHRYILNLPPGQTYTRHYASQGKEPGFYVPNDNGKDPELKNPRYRLRGNGVWTLEAKAGMPDERWAQMAYRSTNAQFGPDGAKANDAGAPAEVVFKVQSANVTTAQRIVASFANPAGAAIAVSVDNGLHWKDVWSGKASAAADVHLVDDVNGAYETLVGVRLADGARLASLSVTTTTALNAKTQPRLNVGKNTVYVGAGEQSDSIVLWPELQNGTYKQTIVDEKNVKSTRKHPGYMGTLHPAKAKEDAYVVYRIDAPRDLTKVTYGGRFYNRAPKSHVDLLHSFDGGTTWTKSWSLAKTDQPWDVIHYETVTAPPGVRSVLFKYLMNTPDSAPGGCSIYAVRMEADHQPVAAPAEPLEVTFTWREVQPDRSTVQRAHTRVVEKLPATYTINVGGADHPRVESLVVNRRGDRGPGAPVVPGYADGKDMGGGKWVGRWLTVGRNLAVGKPYTASHPSETNWDAGDPDGTKLTDGVAGPPSAGGTSYSSGAIWKGKTHPTITVDLGRSQPCAAFGMNFHGYPWHDAIKGQVKDRVEVLVSDDGQTFTPVGQLDTNLWWKDIPVNHVWPDDEQITGHTFRLVPPAPVTARYVRYQVTSDRMFCCTELEVLDAIKSEPHDLRVALPGR